MQKALFVAPIMLLHVRASMGTGLRLVLHTYVDGVLHAYSNGVLYTNLKQVKYAYIKRVPTKTVKKQYATVPFRNNKSLVSPSRAQSVRAISSQN